MPHPAVRSALVTGGCGFIGRAIVARLLADGTKIVVLDNLSAPASETFEERKNLTVAIGSVLDSDLVRRLIEPVDTIYHLAGIVGVEAVSRDPQLAFDTTARGTANVLDNLGDRSAVLFSSSAVYGLRARDAPDDAPIDESQALAYDGGVRGYASGKYVLEMLGRQAQKNGADVMMVRPFNVVGPGQSGAEGMVLPRSIARALLNLPLTIYDDGKQRRSFAHIRTFVDSLLKLAQAPNRASGAFNIGCPTTVSILELSALIQSELNLETTIRFVPFEKAFPGKEDVKDRVPNCARFEEAVGHVNWPPAGDIVRDVALWMRALTPQQLQLHARRIGGNH